MPLIEARAVPSITYDGKIMAEHVWVNCPEFGTFDCWGGHGEPSRSICSTNTGSYNWPNNYRFPVGPLPDTALIGVYGSDGVCHQSANCFLYPSCIMLNYDVIGYGLTEYLYGTYGKDFSRWLEYPYGTHTQNVPYSLIDGQTTDPYGDAKNRARSVDPSFNAIHQAYATAGVDADANTLIIAGAAARLAYMFPENANALRSTNFFQEHRAFLDRKVSMVESGDTGEVLAQQINQIGREMCVWLRDYNGSVVYRALMGTDSVNIDIIPPGLYAITGVPVPLPPPGVAEFVSQNVPDFMCADRTFSASVTFRNKGSFKWTSSRYSLVSKSSGNTSTPWGPTRIPVPDGPDGIGVPVGSVATFNFQVTPNILGESSFRWIMERNNVGQFEAQSPVVKVMVARDSLFVSQSVMDSMVAGTTQTVTITLRNVGTATWSKAGNYKLGSQHPESNMTWGISRVELPHDVPPQSEVTFTFQIRAPADTLRRNFQWQMVHENVGWLGQPTPNVEISVMPSIARAAGFVSQSVPQKMASGSTQAVSVTMRNIGTETWTAASPFKLGSQNSPNNTHWGMAQVAVPHDVPPNAYVTFNFSILARNTEGTVAFKWQMLKQGVGSFGQLTDNVDVVLVPPIAPLDVYFVKTKDTASGKIEVLTATSKSSYASGAAWATRFGAADGDNGIFGIFPIDLYFVKTKNTGTGKVEVFTATALSNYVSGISSATVFNPADADNGQFGMFPSGDFYFVKTKNTVGGMVVAHTVTAASGYQTRVSKSTRFTSADADNGRFGMLPNGDVYFVKTKNAASGKVELHTATTASNYQSGLSTATRFILADGLNGSFGMLPNGDVYFVKTKNAASGKVELHTATAASAYQSGLTRSTRFSLAEADRGWFGML